MRVADQTAASVLRTVAGWHTLLSAQFFKPLASGWVGVEPAVVVVIIQFLQTYQKQLRHTVAHWLPHWGTVAVNLAHCGDSHWVSGHSPARMTVRILGLVGERKGGCPTLTCFNCPVPGRPVPETSRIMGHCND